MSDVSKIAAALIAALTPFVNAEDETNVVQLKTHPMDKPAVAKSSQEARSDLFDSEVWALSSCKGYYIPWNKEIHATTRAVNADGTFRKLKGKDAPSAEDFIKLEGAWLDKFGLEVELYEQQTENGKPVAIGDTADHTGIVGEIENAPTKPARPAKPGKPATPSKPVKPGKPTKPSAGEKVSSEHKLALGNINDLVKRGINFDAIIERFLEPLGASSFEEVAADDHKELAESTGEFLHFLITLDGKRKALQEMDDAHDGEDELIVTFEDVIDQFSETGLAGIAVEDFEEVLAQTKQMVVDWNEYYESLGE